jgi:hypothetical protein
MDLASGFSIVVQLIAPWRFGPYVSHRGTTTEDPDA